MSQTSEQLKRELAQLTVQERAELAQFLPQYTRNDRYHGERHSRASEEAEEETVRDSKFSLIYQGRPIRNCNRS